MEDLFIDDDQYINFNVLYGLQLSDQPHQPKLFQNLKKQNPPSHIASNLISKQSNHQPFQFNKNNKNKYINKINQMSKESKNQQPDQLPTTVHIGSRKTSHSGTNPNYTLKQEDESEINSGKPSQKLQRNRISAKNSRQRKKLYMDLLEKQIIKLEGQKIELSKSIQDKKNQINKFINNNQTQIGLSIGKQTYTKKLQKLIETAKPQNDHQEINIILDSLSMRIGATGKMRVNLVNEYFKQILNLGFPVLYRYLLWCASQQKHLFSQKPELQNQWYKIQQFQVTPDQIKQLTKSKLKLIEYKKRFFGLFEKLMIEKKKLYNQQQQLQKEMDSLRNVLTPIQCAQIILFIEKNKYKQEFNLQYSKKRKHVQSQTTKQDQKIDKEVIMKKRKIE